MSGKSEGVRPGFTIKDAARITWFISNVDAPGYPEQATGAEVVSTKLFLALGYDVAETHVATIRREDVLVGSNATITVHDKKRPLTAGDIDRVLAQVDRAADGTYRALASKALAGKPVEYPLSRHPFGRSQRHRPPRRPAGVASHGCIRCLDRPCGREGRQHARHARQCR